jgi:hypothetical protein
VGETGGREEVGHRDRDRPAEGSREAAPTRGAVDAGRLATDVGAPSGEPLGGIGDGAAGVVDETQEVVLGCRATAADAAALWLCRRTAGGAYEACSAVGAPVETWSEPVPASAWWASMPQERDPGSDAFGHRRPVDMTAAQRPWTSSSS